MSQAEGRHVQQGLGQQQAGTGLDVSNELRGGSMGKEDSGHAEHCRAQEKFCSGSKSKGKLLKG